MKILLLQARHANDRARLEERHSFALKARLKDEQIVPFDLLSGTLTLTEIRKYDALMIGGSGEKKTFGLAARYFDHLNLIASFAELPRKMEALRTRCAEVGRDPATLETSVLLTVVPDPGFAEDRVPEEFPAWSDAKVEG